MAVLLASACAAPFAAMSVEGFFTFTVKLNHAFKNRSQRKDGVAIENAKYVGFPENTGDSGG